MGISPGVLHLNEGHSGFAVFEAIRMRMEEEGIDFDAAALPVPREVVFTTHTPVPAGHDRFAADLIEEHLGPLREQLGISHENLMGFGRVYPDRLRRDLLHDRARAKLSRRANAVSSLHGEVSREMWTGLFPGKPADAVPIGHITNGVHVPSWLAPQMYRLYDRHLGPDWHDSQHRQAPQHGTRSKTSTTASSGRPTSASSRSCSTSSAAAPCEQAERRGEPPECSQRLGKVLSPDALTIGFARRFATYKRANLLLADIERLAAMINDPKRPVQFVFAGKAHPHDEPGKRVLQQIAEMMRDPSSATSSCSSRTTTSTSAAIWSRASMSGSTIRAVRWRPPAPAGRRSCSTAA